MKLLSFTFLTCFSLSSNAIDFNSCTDASGTTHFTNLPSTSLGLDCKPKDQYTVMLNQDYLNLDKEYSKYAKENSEVTGDNTQSFEISRTEISPDSVKNKIKDILNPDKALEELMEATEDRDDPYTRAMRSRSNGIENIINQGRDNAP